jgi:hypothetical protein
MTKGKQSADDHKGGAMQNGMNAMRKVARRLIAKLDKFLTSRSIPITSFGCEQSVAWRDHNGAAIHRMNWHWPESWREPFYEHNRRLHDMAIAVRKFGLRF